MNLNRYNYSFLGVMLFHITVLLLIADNFSISYSEANIYFNQTSFISYVANISTSIFGMNNFSLRVPFILFYIASGGLLYLLTDDYFKQQWDRLISLSLFMILPGVNSAALLLNESIVVIFCTLLYLYIYKITKKNNFLLLTIFLFIDNSFAILYLGLFFYSLKKRDNALLVISLILFGISMSMYGFDIGGRPRGYLVDTFGVYATIFSPILFLYFFYSLYRVAIKYPKDIFWYIAFTAFLLSFMFSLRQKIDIEDFAPFVVIAIPIMVKLFMHSVRIRLKEFRKLHYIAASVVVAILVLNFSIFVFNKYLYIFIENPKKHFAYDYHIAQELAERLKSLNIDSISVNDKELALRLKYYGINHGNDYYLTSTKIHNKENINIKYYGKLIASYTLK